MEVYKVDAEYRAYVNHQRSGETIAVWARVVRNLNNGSYRINYSHTFQPSEGAGMWYSDSFTSATSLESAEALVLSWLGSLETGYAIGRWSAED
jgi:hypothetical protein